MSISVTHTCGERFDAPDAARGRALLCPGCGKPVAVPLPPRAERPAAPPEPEKPYPWGKALGLVTCLGLVIATGVFLSRLPRRADKPRKATAKPTNPHAWLAAGPRPWDGGSLALTCGHTGPVTHVAFVPGASKLVSASADGTARVWDIATGDELLRFPLHQGPLTALAVSEDGKMAATACPSKVAVWEVATGKELYAVHNVQNASALAFSPDGKRVFLGADSLNALSVWTLASWLEEHLPFAKPDAVAAHFTPDGKEVRFLRKDGLVTWDIEKGTRRVTPLDPKPPLARTQASGRALLAHADELCLWSLEPPKKLRRLRGHEGPVHVVALSADGRRGLAGGEDRRVRLWDLTAEAEEPSRVLDGHTAPVRCLAFSTDGKLAASGGDDQTVRIWNLDEGGLLHCLNRSDDHPDEVFSATFQYVLAIRKTWRTVLVWDVEAKKQVCELAGHTRQVYGLAFSEDERLAATSSEDGTARVWEVATGREVARLAGHGAAVFRVALSKDGTQALTGTGDGTVRLWDVGAAKVVGEVKAHGRAISALAFSPDGKEFLTSSEGDKVVRRWDAATRAKLGELAAPATTHVAYSPDAKQVLLRNQGGTVMLFLTANGRPAVRHEAWTNAVTERWKHGDGVAQQVVLEGRGPVGGYTTAATPSTNRTSRVRGGTSTNTRYTTTTTYRTTTITIRTSGGRR